MLNFVLPTAVGPIMTISFGFSPVITTLLSSIGIHIIPFYPNGDDLFNKTASCS
jgi:hypothetical protein